jgi:hypothetical protein
VWHKAGLWLVLEYPRFSRDQDTRWISTVNVRKQASPVCPVSQVAYRTIRDLPASLIFRDWHGTLECFLSALSSGYRTLLRTRNRFAYTIIHKLHKNTCIPHSHMHHMSALRSQTHASTRTLFPISECQQTAVQTHRLQQASQYRNKSTNATL